MEPDARSVRYPTSDSAKKPNARSYVMFISIANLLVLMLFSLIVGMFFGMSRVDTGGSASSDRSSRTADTRRPMRR
jgi:hypothetical protein